MPRRTSRTTSSVGRPLIVPTAPSSRTPLPRGALSMRRVVGRVCYMLGGAGCYSSSSSLIHYSKSLTDTTRQSLRSQMTLSGDGVRRRTNIRHCHSLPSISQPYQRWLLTERPFSLSKLAMTSQRQSMHPETLEFLQCLKNWSLTRGIRLGNLLADAIGKECREDCGERR